MKPRDFEQKTLSHFRKLTPEERNREIPKYVIDAIRQRWDKGFPLPLGGTDFPIALDGFPQPHNGAIALQGMQTAEELLRQAYPLPVHEKQSPLAAAIEENEKVRQIKKTGEIANSAIPDNVAPQKFSKVEEVIGQAAAKIAKDVNANCVISIEKKEQSDTNPNCIDVKVVVFKRLKTNFHKVEYLTQMRRLVSGSVIPIKELLMEAINKKYIAKDDRVVCVSDESLGSGYKGLLFIFDVDKVFFNMSMYHLADKISPEVIETVINLALEIGSEGREGKPIGTAFIIGDPAELARYTRQMIINPFSSVPEHQRRITDANLLETVKGFSQLEGWFVVNPEGIVMSAGTHLNLDLNEIDLSHMQGFGTRHRYCAAITKATDAISIVVSESGGTVRIFKKGELVMKLP